MAFQNINIGAAPNDGTGDTLREAGDKINQNLAETANKTGETFTGTVEVVGGALIARGGGNIAFNTAVGDGGLASNTTGENNTAVGQTALLSNTTGVNNFAVGRNSGNDPVRTITTQSNEGVLGNDDTAAIYSKVALTVTSDIRDKTQVQPVGLGLSFVQSVQPIQYKFKSSRTDSTPTGRTHLGFSAQEILALQGKAEIVDDSDPENLKLNTSDLIAVLFNAVTELSAQVEELKNNG